MLRYESLKQCLAALIGIATFGVIGIEFPMRYSNERVTVTVFPLRRCWRNWVFSFLLLYDETVYILTRGRKDPETAMRFLMRVK